MEIKTLLNLQRLLVGNKFFSKDPISINFTIGAAKISNSVLDQIIEYYQAEGDSKKVNEWLAWRNLELKKESELASTVTNKIKELVPTWSELDKAKRDEIIRSFFSPYIVDPDDVERLYLNQKKGTE